MRALRSPSTVNIWPGFVDVLSGLLMTILFALIIFMVAQFYLTEALSTKDKSLGNLQKIIQELSTTLGIEKKQRAALDQQFQQTQTNVQQLSSSLSREISQKEQAFLQIEALKEELSQLNQQILRLNEVLQVSEKTVENKNVQLQDLNVRLQEALEEKFKELSAYRSEFFGKLKEALGKRDDIRIVGDRFVFQSEVLFDLGSDRLGQEGTQKLMRLAQTLKEIAAKIPREIHWILRVDGHTDTLPIKTQEFKSNWELSTARAVSVVKFLIQQGIDPQNLAAAGFGEFNPLDKGKDPQSLSRNRRIELKLDQR